MLKVNIYYLISPLINMSKQNFYLVFVVLKKYLHHSKKYVNYL